MNEYNTVYNPYVMNMLGFGSQQGGNINLGNGYNAMPYYSGNYEYFNPYLIQQQQQAIYEQQMAEYKRIEDMNNLIDETARKVSGRHLVKPEDEYELTQEEQMEQYERFMAIQDMNLVNNINDEAHRHKNLKYVLHASSFVNNLEKAQQEMPNDMSTLDMLKVLSNKNIEYANKELVKARMGYAYNSNQYNQLLQRDGNGYFQNTFGRIDDMSGNIVSNEYMEKKKKFMEAISKQMY